MTDSDHKLALQLGEQLDEYRLVRVLGAGGFGVTYLAEHIQAGNRVAIKEYLPNELAVREGATVHPKSSADREGFAWGLARFLDEARTLARFEHRNVVRVQRYFEANNTAYLVMDYEDGASLGELLKEHGTLSEAQLRRVLMPIVDGLRAVHAAGFLHRDIKPDNIFVRRSDESPVLLDFGAARQALGHRSRSLTGVITAGYSPPEQYESDGNQGPWTDVYALSALCCKAITGSTPVDVLDRQREIFRNRRADPLPRLADNPPEDYSRPFLEAVDWGLRLSEEDRPQTLDDWVTRLDAPQDTGPGVPLSSQEPSRRRGVSRWAIGGSLAAAAAVAAAVVFWFMAGGPLREPQPAEQVGEQAPLPAPAGPELQAGATDTSTPGEPMDPKGGSAILVVTTAPEGVEVALEGQVVGRTPVELRDLRAGAYSVTLRHPDYETVRLDDQRLADRRVLRIVQEMTRATGALTIITQPADAWIERDGERLAEGTPVTLENLPAGSARLVLGAHEHRSVTVQVDVPKDAVAMLERTLVPIPYGTLTLEVVPADATVKLPDIEPAYRAGMRLPEGEHRVTVRRAGYREMTQTVTVSGDTRRRIKLELVPRPQPGETFSDALASGGEGPRLVVLPSGSFRMGCLSDDDACADDERPVHQVRIAEQFALSRHEVAVGEFARFVDETGHWTGDSCWTYEGGEAENRAGRSWTSPGFRQADDHAAVCVNWDDAVAYVAWLSRETGEEYRLPSESEWEYAARAGTVTRYSWGDEIGRNRANCGGCGSRWDGEGTAPVGSFAPNAWGLHDMHGNVSEWVEDCWNDSYEGAPGDGSAWHRGDCAKRVVRGSSWFSSPRPLRSAYRGWGTSGYSDYIVGFRVARTLTP